MMAGGTDSPSWVNQRSVPLEYRFLVAMQGSLGIGAYLNKWTPGDLSKAKQMVAEYKAIRGIVQRGRLYRLVTPERDSCYSVTESVSRDRKQIVSFAFLHSSRELYPFPCIYLRGLDRNTTTLFFLLRWQVASRSEPQRRQVELSGCSTASQRRSSSRIPMMSSRLSLFDTYTCTKHH